MRFTYYEVLPFILTNLLREEVEEHNSHHSGSPDVDPSQDLIRVTNVLLRWYKLFRQTTSAKTPSDVGICKPSLTGLFPLYTIYILYTLPLCAVDILQPVSCKKVIYCSHQLPVDPVMLRPPGFDNGAFVVSPETVWYAQVLLLFSASAKTDTGSKSFDCARMSTMETYDDPKNGCYFYCMYDINYTCYMCYI